MSGSAGRPSLDLLKPALGFDSSMRSFDRFVRLKKNGLRDRDPDLLCRFQIDHQLELRRLLDGDVGRLGAFQDLVDVTGAIPALDAVAGSVSHQAAVFCVIAPSTYRWQS